MDPHHNHNHHHHHGGDGSHRHNHQNFNQQFATQQQQAQGGNDNNGFSGEATMRPTPGDGAFTNAFDNQNHLNKLIRSNLYIILTLAVVAVFVATRLFKWYQERTSANQVAEIHRSRTGDEAINDGIRQARERQMRAVQEAQKRDSELREQRRLEDLAEKERKLKERQQQQQLPEGGVALGFTERLPTLPSGNNYRPFSDSSNNGGGGSYRPTGFARPRRGG